MDEKVGAATVGFNGGGIGDRGAAMVVGCDNGDGIGDGGTATGMVVYRWWDWRRRGCVSCGDGGGIGDDGAITTGYKVLLW
ncbi:hypothetical protein TIFTF001_011145 [Ficus carica]|uniref:Uncharacterized protein n=1 Tax=Ficus carica TaxID=3494 RepID=A0AA87ZSX7_FICCA|nr:hypothetical protein TIFTF001_011145 [Ficus carica]